MTRMIFKYFIQSEHIYAGQAFIQLFPETEPLTVTLERQKELNAAQEGLLLAVTLMNLLLLDKNR